MQSRPQLYSGASTQQSHWRRPSVISLQLVPHVDIITLIITIIIIIRSTVTLENQCSMSDYYTWKPSKEAADQRIQKITKPKLALIQFIPSQLKLQSCNFFAKSWFHNF